MQGREGGAERMNGRSAREQGVFGEVAVLPGGSNGPNLPTKSSPSVHASTKKHARHYEANFGFA